jgi:hypothetical protein
MRIAGSGAVIDFGDDTTTQIYRDSALQVLAFSTSSTERLRIASNGNIGIGTNNPSVKLHIVNNLTDFSSSLYVYNPTNSASQISQVTCAIAGTSANKAVYTLDVFGSHGWSMYTSGNNTNFNINSTYNCNPLYDRITIANNGNIGIGISNPGFRLEVAASTNTAVSITGRFLDTQQVNSFSGNLTDICAKFNGAGVWVTGYFIASSDSRIKEDIQDINDDSALQSILSIQPKTYKYVDKFEKGDKKVYGFIAQQIKDVIPEAVSIQASYIPNIYSVADYSNNVITLPSQPTKVVIKVNDTIKCYDKDNKELLVEVIEVIDDLTFRIKDIEYTDSEIFVYGTFVDDFHTLNKDDIFTLNVCATQELNRRIETQNVVIQSHEDRIKELEMKMERMLSGTT